MTTQLSALEGSDNFNYLTALQDVCSRLENTNNPSFVPLRVLKRIRPNNFKRPKRHRKPNKRRRRRRRKVVNLRNLGFYLVKKKIIDK